MKATKSGMAAYTTQELIDHVKSTDAKYKKAPAFIKRTSFARWASNSAAIAAEIQTRMLTNI